MQLVFDRIHRTGPIPFDEFVELALYSDDGFFASGHGAGREGRDFVTSPETGSLFGAVVAHAIDAEWDRLGQPDPYVVIEAGAGNGRLAREVQRAVPRCSAALHYVLVERSAMLRAEQAERLPLVAPEIALGGFHVVDRDDPPEPATGQGPIFTALDRVPSVRIDGIVIANELLDNLPFGIAVFDGERWGEVRVGAEGNRLVETIVPCDPPDCFGATPIAGTRIPLERTMTPWLREAALCLRRGRIVVIDYIVAMEEIIARSPQWLRGYANHRAVSDPLVAAGSCDITADVPLEQLERAAHRCGLVVEARTTQADWLASNGLEELVEEARRYVAEHPAMMDLAALAARSRINEAAAITDRSGLGGFDVVTLRHG